MPYTYFDVKTLDHFFCYINGHILVIISGKEYFNIFNFFLNIILDKPVLGLRPNIEHQ